MSTFVKTDIYSMITQRMIDALEKGTVPWQKQWKTDGIANGMARNFISNKPYRGINSILTNYSAFTSPFWLTYNQSASLGGQVRKGSVGTPIVFWGKATDSKGKPNADGSPREFMFPKYFTAFNAEQIDGIDFSKKPELKDSIEEIGEAFTVNEKCENIISGFKGIPEITFTSPRAYYRPSTDTVNMPLAKSFISSDAYYSVLFHELTHSTGHVSRLSRENFTGEKIASFGSHDYSKEELIAEMGASFLCGHVGIDSTFDQSAAYIASWLKVLRNDTKLVMSAASAAQKSTDFILGISAAEVQS